MKLLKIQVFGLIMLLCGSFSLHGMKMTAQGQKSYQANLKQFAAKKEIEANAKEEERKKNISLRAAKEVVKYNSTPAQIAALQKKYPEGSYQGDLIKQALIAKYYDEYAQQINEMQLEEPHIVINDLMNDVSDGNSFTRMGLLTTDLNTLARISDDDGTNWGKGGLRYQALERLLTLK